MGVSFSFKATLSFLEALLFGILGVFSSYLVVVIGEPLLVLVVTH
tara:strand:+ start:832 stop:966 length:135 start_codon:yes stop_codon:yes gene_type:complete